MENRKNPNAEPATSPKPLSQILRGSSFAPNSALTTSTPSQANSLTTGRDAESRKQIGRPLSETMHAELRGIAQSVRQGATGTDKALLTLLGQYYGSALSAREIKSPVYDGHGGYRERQSGWEITATSPADATVIEALEFINRPAPLKFIEGKLAELRVQTVRRNESNDDVQLLIASMAARLKEFPADIIAAVFEDWMEHNKFFPTRDELIPMLNERFMFRRALLEAVKNPKEPQPKIETRIDYRNVPRAQWGATHFLQRIQDAIGFADVWKKNSDAAGEYQHRYLAKLFLEEAIAKFPGCPEINEFHRLAAETNRVVNELEARAKEGLPADSPALGTGLPQNGVVA